MADPPHLQVGAVLGGFETEGGYNGPGQPAHNWCWWEAEGRVPPGPASGGSWRRWDVEVARVAAAGFDTVQVSVEWARCEPLDGETDPEGVAGYARLIDVCHEHGLQPVVTLHRWTHPAWMGVDLWLRPDAPERFRAWVERAVDHFAGRAHRWVTVHQLNAGPLSSYLAGRHPPGRRLDVGATIRSLDHRLAAHVLAYEAIKERQPHAVVATGNRHLPVYELDRLLVDVQLGRSAGVARHDLHEWLVDRRIAYAGGGDGHPGRLAGGLAGLVGRLTATAVPLEQALARSVAAVYDSAWERPVDVLEVTAQSGDPLRVTPRSGDGGRVPSWRRRAGRIEEACRANRDLGLPLSVVGDAPVGVDHLRANLAEVQRALTAGAPVTGYRQRLHAPALERLAGDRHAGIGPRA